MKNIDNLFIAKSVIFIIIALIMVVLVGVVFNYIYKQNMEYRKLNEETVVEQEVKEGIEGEIPAELELPEREESTMGTEEKDYRDNTIMIF